MSQASINRLTVAYRSLPAKPELDFAKVRTLDVHEVLIFLSGPPLFSAGPYVEKLFVSGCTHSTDFSEWTLNFRSDAKFSDGSPLRAEHWYHSVARTIRVGSGVHFNPRQDILGGSNSQDGYCEGLILSQNSVKIRLTKPNRNFDRLLGKIEASILPISESTTEGDILRLPSAGPYRIDSYTQNRITLAINPNFPGHRGRAAFKEINLLRMSDDEAVRARIDGKVDFIFPLNAPSEIFTASLKATSQTVRDFGQTVFVSFLTQRAGSAWTNPANRQALAHLLREIRPAAGLEQSTTLLMGPGLGRLSNGPAAPSAVGSLPKLSLAAVDRPYSRQILEHLKAGGVEVTVVWAPDFNGLYTGAASTCDAIIGWNDFCGEDPYISLYNALNPDRPLIADNGSLRDRLTQLQAIEDPASKDLAYRRLHESILSAFSVIPVFHHWMDAYAAPHLNVHTMKGGALWTLE